MSSHRALQKGSVGWQNGEALHSWGEAVQVPGKSRGELDA